MKQKKIRTSIYAMLAVYFSVATVSIFAQSGREYRRTAIHNGNLVRTVFGNWGVIGQPSNKGPRGAWLFDTNGYIGDVSPIVGVEVKYFDQAIDTTIKFHSVVVCPIDRPSTGTEESPTGKQWGFEPVSGYFNENYEKVAMSTDPVSWPSYWPDKQNDPEDSGWPGQWNGFFGKGVTNADQESYFVMDDNNDEEFNFKDNNNVLLPKGGFGVEFKPDSTNMVRNGLGLEVKVRGMQWAQFLAADVIFWLYEISNHSTTNYDKVVFGMLAGTYNGVTGTDDSPQEYNDDYSFFDVQRDLTYTGDYPNNNSRNPKWQGPAGMVGYAFLESPGNPYDGIDNDGDNREDGANPGSNLIFTAPYFQETDFDTIIYDIGDEIVIIDNDFERSVVTITQDTQIVRTRGLTLTIIAGETKLVEGNFLEDGSVNTNVYDGVDNDLDGLIDENYLLHYRQRRVDQDGIVLFDTLNPVAYKDFRSGLGVDDPLIDERRDDGIDNDGDWNPDFDDVGADGKDGTFDYGEGDERATLGEPNFDKTDVDESDQIGLTSFNYFTPANLYPVKDDEKLWDWLQPGYFEVPSSIQNNKPVAGEDGDFIYGSAYFPLPAGKTERFSLALVYGHDIDDLLKNRETVQKIYNSDYRFPQPPDKPVVSAAIDDGQVTLYWDRKSEDSIDPVTKERDFEGYKIYKASDPDFTDAFVVTNVNGVVTGYRPIAQFDKKNGIEGIFEPSSDLYQQAEGFTFNLGSETGLQHTYVDNDVQNGRQYYYAVVAYDHGDVENDIFPSENTKFISVQNDGSVITDVNTIVVRPGPPVAGYKGQNSDRRLAHLAGPATGSIQYSVVDEKALTGHTYRVFFTDTATDSIDNDNDWDPLVDDIGNGLADPDPTANNGIPNVGEPDFDWMDPDEFAPKTSTYSIMDLNGFTETVTLDTSYHALTKMNIEITSMLISPVADPGNYLDVDAHFDFIMRTSKIRIKPSSSLASGDYRISYQFYPVYRSENIKNSPYAPESIDSDIFDGIQLSFTNHWSLYKIDSLSFWNNTERTLRWSFRVDKAALPNGKVITGIAYPSQYELQFSAPNVALYETPQSLIVYTNQGLPEFLWTPPKKTNFRLWNIIDSTTVPFVFTGSKENENGIYELKPNCLIESYILKPDSVYQYSWVMSFSTTEQDTPRFQDGDKLTIEVTRPYRKDDVFEFTTEVPTTDTEVANLSLDDIQVVPNPYVVANIMEAPLPPSITSGRGERRIEFRKLPENAKVHIFTASGAHVITLNQSGNIHNGTLAWNLKTKENLDIAYGVYFYIVESSVGKKSGKIAIIK